MFRNKYLFCLLSVFAVIACKQKTAEVADKEKKDRIVEKKQIFKKLEANSTGVNFENNITENLETLENLFNFDYFYNGAGVGVEDINNDGLLDIFFCGNQVPNRLYLNKGNLQFEDITETAGINQGKIWSNGVAFVDINNDGWMDIYVSQGGPNNRPNRKNLLFINQKNNTFLENADEYGLADMGISTQSAFFDYDRDGDLDCIVMNENEYYGVDPINLYRMVEGNLEAQYFNSSHFYRNDNGRFVDVTKEVGIQRPIFGLGLAISDINNDGWLDFYIASDYYIPDALFINEKGVFVDKIKEYTNQISFYGMGIDIADVNNDSKQDIFVLDMASSDHKRSKTLMASMSTDRFDYLVNKANFHYQYMYNSFQLNIGNNKFNNIAQMTKTANTDWSWSVLLTDFDLDQDKDIYVTNGYRRYALDNDVQNKVFEARMKYGKNVPLEIKKQLYYDMPSEKLQNILYENQGNLKFVDRASEWGLEDFTFSNGAAQADLDNDGDYDLVVNNIDDKALVYQNVSVERNEGNYLKIKLKGVNSEPFAKVSIKYGGKEQYIESRRIKGYRSSHDNSIIFGLGNTEKVDTLKVEWNNGSAEIRYDIPKNSVITLDIVNAKPLKPEADKVIPLFKESEVLGQPIVHKENPYDDFEEEILLPYKQSTLGPFMSKGDFNGDGLEDVFIGGASGQAGQLLKNIGSGFVAVASKALDNDKGHEDMESVFFDFDNDGDLDLFVVSGGNEFDENSSFFTDRLYINDGKGNFTKAKQPELEKYPKNGKTVTPIDFDNDGDLDLLVGNRVIPRNYPKFQPSTIFENKKGRLVDVTEKVAPELANFGIINDFVATDFDNDGQQDFIAVGEWTGIGLFKNQNGSFQNVAKEKGLGEERGWWFSIAQTDVNNDGLKDYVVGNVGLNIKFKANKKKPFKVFADDFDGNGTNDIVLSKEYNGAYVPVRGRECSSQQMPFIKEKFETYNEFANATLVDIYGEDLSNAFQSEATEFNSIVLVNRGSGDFEKILLPVEAQMFPILSIDIYDLNGDGFEDCVIAGNLYETEVETPRLDAFSGLALLSNQENGYQALTYEETGLYLDGNTKDALFVDLNGTKHLLVSKNNDRAQSFVYQP
ncbi:MAG: hypothetical protein CMH48_09120 [Muricauda sp.]|nr:VCBS repeat-containing protein [Allomuricauda sp.]MAU26350.1 hypothetical protein [Allomuricauda sp.]MBC30995.1 hypothetical protein [Allomuricauda sp.]|tara:strand:- start:43971 stop:47303 length:3333 start_codon:yes stop_codon:yes gene_type:complete